MDEYVNDTRWTGRPMVESYDTTDFFEQERQERAPLEQEAWSEDPPRLVGPVGTGAGGLVATAARLPSRR